MEHDKLSRCEVHLTTSDNQFCFKSKHSTDQCIFAFKEVVRYYIIHGSPVFACYLDASKAFDRVNHWTLFHKLVKRGVPSFLIKVLVYWYHNQSLCVRWGKLAQSSLSSPRGYTRKAYYSSCIDDMTWNYNWFVKWVEFR